MIDEAEAGGEEYEPGLREEVGSFEDYGNDDIEMEEQK
jgi:hypothetical protein